MRPYLEYMRRRGLLRPQFAVPCCFPVFSGPLGGDARLVALHSMPTTGEYLVKRWFIDSTPLEMPLPPSEDAVMSLEDILEGYAVPPGWSILPPEAGVVPTSNDPGPMSEKQFAKYYEGIWQHQTRVRDITCILWYYFVNAYNHKLGLQHPPFEGYSTRQSQHEKMIVSHDFRRHWQYWEIWASHMLHFRGIVPELVMSNVATTGFKLNLGRLGRPMEEELKTDVIWWN